MEIQNKVCIITGSTSGLGRQNALELAKMGARLVLPVRDLQKGESLVGEILRIVPNAQVETMHCDLASFASIRMFVDQFKSRYDQLHLLINNAGIWQMKRNISEDGFELTFAVNHLAPFLMTNLLLQMLINNSPARIITVSSEAHRHAGLDIEDIGLLKGYSPIKAYRQSKLANILFTKKLSQLLKGTGVTANCLHPGVVRTSFFLPLPFPVRWFISPFMISPQKGSLTTTFLATSPDCASSSGEYFVRCKPHTPGKNALRKDIADILWEISSKYVGF